MIQRQLLLICAIALTAFLLVFSSHSANLQGREQINNHAYLVSSCAPWDGAAVTLYLTQKSNKCDRISPPYYMISLFRNLKEIPIGSEIKIDSINPNQQSQGDASKCPKPNACQPLKQPRIRFDAISANSVRGEFSYQLMPDRQLIFPFTGKICPYIPLCG